MRDLVIKNVEFDELYKAVLSMSIRDFGIDLQTDSFSYIVCSLVKI